MFLCKCVDSVCVFRPKKGTLAGNTVGFQALAVQRLVVAMCSSVNVSDVSTILGSTGYTDVHASVLEVSGIIPSILYVQVTWKYALFVLFELFVHWHVLVQLRSWIFWEMA